VTTLVFDNEAGLAAALADRMLAAIARKPDIVFGLPTGRTPRRLYEELAARSRSGGPDWSRVRTFNLDEFVGLGGDDPGSYRHFMEQALFSAVGLPREHAGFLDGRAADFDAECRRYERAIADAGGIDLMVLGIGVNGHIGFNEPGPWLHARTHRAALEPATRAANAGLFEGDASRVPRYGLSMGMATILHSRAVVLIATGDEKAAALAATVDGPITTAVPASFLQVHADVTLMIDRQASASTETPGSSMP
jgi:glucosamine-6-phosphate deaminase